MAVEQSQIEQLIQCGSIHVGMTREALFALIGTPDAEGGTSRKYNLPCIYKYGDVQFVFPQSHSASEALQQGLTFAYIDDSETIDEVRYLVR